MIFRAAKKTNINAIKSPIRQYNMKASIPYGKPNRAQTPVKGIINGDYGVEAEKEVNQIYD